MNIDQTPLDFEIRRVLDSNFRPNLYGYTGQFKIGDRIVEIIKITDIDEQADYEMNYGAPINIRIVMPQGDYTSYIYPEKNKLEFILKTEKLNYQTREPADSENSIDVVTYNVSLHPDARPFQAEDNNAESLGREAQNLINFVVMDLQLKPKLLDDIAKVSVGGQFLKDTNANVLRDLITMYCSKLELDDDQKLLGVNIHPAASTEVRKSTIIDHGILLQDLADFIQTKAGGIFPTGMAQFVHKRIWYVYPPYDTEGFDDAKEKIVIISVPAKRFPQVEKTYLTQNGITTILATGNKKITSDKSAIQDNAGNGVMFTDANQIVSGFSKEKGNVAVVRRSKNNTEFVGEQMGDGKNNVRVSPEGITSNPFVARSRIARSQGHFYTVEWENADPELIKPGINVKILYINGDEVKEVTGVLIKSHKQVKMNGTGLLASGYRTFMVLMIFVKSSGVEEGGLLGLE